jgi:hypothetical protein
MNSTKSTGSRLGRKLLVFSLPILIIFAGLEIGARLISAFTPPATTVMKNFIFVPGKIEPAKTGSLPVKPNVEVVWSNPEWDVKVKTNSYGLRETTDTPLSQVSVAFFGDSFTFGWGVEDNQQYSDSFAQNSQWPRNEIVNFSWPNGFQPEHYEYFLKSNPELNPKIAIVGLYLGNDLDSDLAETQYDPQTNTLELNSRSVNKNGQLVNIPSNLRWPWRISISWSEFSKLSATLISVSRFNEVLYKPGMGRPNTPNSVELEQAKTDLLTNRAITSLTRIDSLIQSRGGKLYVLVIPQSYYFGEFPNPHLNPELIAKRTELVLGPNLKSQTLATCMQLKLSCIDSTPWLSAEDYFIQDGHWTAGGQAAVGEALAAQLAQSASNQ